MSWTKHKTEKKGKGVGEYKLEKEDYFSTKDFLEKYGEDVKIVGGYINTKSKLGAHPTLFVETTDGVKGLSLNKSYTEQFEAIFNDPEDVQTILDGNATGKLVKRHSDTYKTDYVALDI